MRISLALPPDSSETFVREVDENLRRDQARDFARTYGEWLIGAVILLLAAIGGYLYWQNRQQEQAGAQSEELTKIITDIGDGNLTTAPARLDAMAAKGNDAYRASALLTRAALAIQQRDLKLAAAKYREVAADDGLPQPYRDLATIRGTAVEFDTIRPEEVVARLQPLTKPGNPWFGSAGELTAMAMIKQNRKTEAGRLFAQIAADKAVPEFNSQPRGADRRIARRRRFGVAAGQRPIMTDKEKFRMHKRIAILMIATALASGCNPVQEGPPQDPGGRRADCGADQRDRRGRRP